MVLVCEVMIGTGAVLARHEVLPGESTISLEFDVEELTFGFQFRCVTLGAAGFSVLRRIQLDEHIA